MLIAIICLFTGFTLGFFTAALCKQHHTQILTERTTNENNWFCPNCGQPMEAQRHVDNPTGRITWTIGCLNPKHFHTRGYMNAAIAEIQLEKLLHQ